MFAAYDAAGSEKLREMVQQYIDKDGKNEDRDMRNQLMGALKSIPARIRVNLIDNVALEKYKDWNVVHLSVERNDVEMMKCLLHDFSPSQVLAVQQIDRHIPYSNPFLHIAARNGYTDTAKYLLESAPDQHEYLCAKDRDENTALYHAATNNHLQTVQVLLSFLSPPEQISLLKETNNSQSVADILSAKYPQALAAADQKLAEQKAEHDGEIKTLTDKLADHDKEIQALKEKLAELNGKLAQISVMLTE